MSLERRAFLTAGGVSLATGLINAQPQSIQVRTLLKQALGAGDNTHAFVQLVELPPGAESGAHRHPGPVIGYVLEGTLELRVEGRPAETVSTGGVFFEPRGVVHQHSKNPSAQNWTRFLAVV